MKKTLSVLASLLIINIVLAGPGWKRTNHTQSTVFTATIQIDEKYANEGDLIGIFVGDECRMISDVFINNGIAYVSAVLHGTEVEEATAKLWVADKDTILDGLEIITTKPEGEIHKMPLTFKSGEETTLIQDTKGFSISPNPFNNSLKITPSKEASSIVMYNSIGQEVLSETANGTEENVLDVSNISKGLYILTVSYSDGSTSSDKVFKK